MRMTHIYTVSTMFVQPPINLRMHMQPITMNHRIMHNYIPFHATTVRLDERTHNCNSSDVIIQ